MKRRGVLSALAAAAIGLAGCGSGLASDTGSTATVPTSPYNAYAAMQAKALRSAESHVHVALPTRRGAAAPVLPADVYGNGLGSHVVLGFLPSWEAAEVSSIDYAELSEVAYYALQVERGGQILGSGPGWQALGDGTAATLVTDAHAAGARALLTLFTETPSTITALARAPSSSGDALAERAAALCAQYHFDGVDLDLEGQEAGDRAGFVRFVTAFSKRFRSLDSTYTIVLNTFPQSAVDPESLFDVKALAPLVDQIFVMAYDMSDLEIPGSASPLTGAELSDASSLASYVSTVAPGKVILGIPFYGYDFTASRREPPSLTVGKAYPVSYDEVVAAGRPALWDPSTETPFTSFKRGRRWHETCFEDPVSVALKVALAAAYKAGGVGAWELGMAVGQGEMTAALDGGSTPVHLGLATQP